MKSITTEEPIQEIVDGSVPSIEFDLDHGHDDVAEPFPYPKFVFAVLSQFALFMGAFYLLLPKMFHSELQHPLAILGWVFLCGLPLSLFEYFYHRYMLHSAVLPFLGSMHEAHSLHHGLTYVKAPVTPKDPEKLVPVKSKYPIEESRQNEAMMFPFYTTSIFFLLFLTLLGLPFKLMFPSQPIITSVLVAVVVQYSAYEIWHAFLHLPFNEFWKPRMEAKGTGKIVSYVYGFHLMHHWRPTSNDAVFGFWGIALWDHLFGTHRRPKNMPLANEKVSYMDAKLTKPRWPVSMLDGWQSGMYMTARKFERTLAKIFVKQTSQR